MTTKSGYTLVRGEKLKAKVEADPVMSAYAKARAEGKSPEEADEIACRVAAEREKMRRPPKE